MTTPQWTAYFEAPDHRDPTPDEAARLADNFPREAGAAIGVGHGISATFTVDAPDVPTAFAAAHTLWREALDAAGLDKWADGRGEVVRADLADADLEKSTTPELVGVSEIAEMLGVTKQRISQLRDRDDFPKPLTTLSAGPVWDRSMLTHFAENWRRAPGRPKVIADTSTLIHILKKARSDKVWSIQVDEAEATVTPTVTVLESMTYATQAKAIEAVREWLEDHGGGELVVHGLDGRVKDRSVVKGAPLPLDVSPRAYALAT